MFAEARAVFHRIRTAYAQHEDATQEFETALQTLIKTYDTAIYENRFVVGGATEMLLCTWIRSLGLRCEPRSGLRTDLSVEGVDFSVKANFAASSTIRLINVLGDSPSAHWNEPTLVLLAEAGLFYIDPEMISKEALRRQADVLMLQTRAVHDFSGTEWHPPIKMPRKPKRGPTSSRIASHDVARSVPEAIHSQVLLLHFPSGGPHPTQN